MIHTDTSPVSFFVYICQMPQYCSLVNSHIVCMLYETGPANRSNRWMTISLLPALVATSGSLESAGAPKWNAQAGVWEGDRAAGSVDIPSPLWIFGYGSLCWRADFPAAESFVGRVQGWRRFFAQSSADHRGTPESPGLVATLISDPQLEAIGLRHADEEPSTTCGVCYRVAEEEARWPFSCDLVYSRHGAYWPRTCTCDRHSQRTNLHQNLHQISTS